MTSKTTSSPDLRLLTTAVELVLGAGWVLVDADDHEARLEALEVGEGTGANGLDDDTGGVQPGSCLIGDLANNAVPSFSPASLVLSGAFCGFCPARSAKTLSRSPTVTVASARLAIAQEAEANAGAGTAAGNVVYEVVAILDGAAIDGGDDVAGLDAALVGGAAGLHLLDEYAVLESVDAVDGAGEAGAE